MFAEAGVRYVGEPTTSGAGLQTVRPVDQVLARPRHGTCLDVCVTYAGACLDAGLHPMIAVLDPRHGGAGHAIVVIWLDGSWPTSQADYPLHEVVHATAPVTEDGFPLTREVRPAVESAGAFLAIDVTGATQPANASAAAKDWAAAVADGAEMITSTGTAGGRWRWGLSVDVGLSRRTVPALDVEDWRAPDFLPLTAPYLEPNPQAGPLTQIKARQGVVPFYARDELDLLLDWAEAHSTVHDGVELAVLHGVGGAGKTHLAAELCRRLDAAGWYAGFLAKHPAPRSEDLAWLAGVESPTLVVVDYVEDTTTESVLSTLKALRGREEPTRVLLTARATGDWLTTITSGAERDGLSSAAPLLVPLPRRHRASAGVFRRAAQRFAELPGRSAAAVEQPPPNPRWTTLDLVLQAWLATESSIDDALPTQRDTLYDRVLQREFEYWQRTCLKRGLPEYPSSLLARVGAVLTLLGPATADRATRAVTAIEELAHPTPDRAVLLDVLIGLLASDTADEGFAIRPDPVGERLVLRELTASPYLLDRCIPVAPATERQLAEHPGAPRVGADVQAAIAEGFRACSVLTRAAEQDTSAAKDLTRRLLDRHISLWSTGLAVALNQGGPFATTLTELAERKDTPLPLAQLATAIPQGHAALRTLALTATQRSRPEPDPANADGNNREAVATWSTILAVRLTDAGDRAGALAAIDEAVALWRQLTKDDPAAFTPDLAIALNNQANQRSDVGDRAGAPAAIDEAVALWRQLTKDDPAAFTPNLAIALNNQANQRSDVGDHAGALAAIDEAVTHYRQLAEANPAAFAPNLAASLNNQANQRSGVGDRAGALAAIDEAVALRRQLAEANPAAFLPDLAMALTNQATARSGVGDRAGALAAIDEAVTHYRQLAEANPAAFAPNLAASLNNQATMRSEIGDRAGALAAIDEAVALRRQLAKDNPAAFLPHLAASLTNQATARSEIGDRAGALAAIDEAVALRRQLAKDNPAAFLPHLAGSLNNQANQRSGVGDRAGALAAIDEAVTHYRQLAEANPAAFAPNLAASLTNQANQRSGVGDRAGALAAIDEAVTHYRQLAEANPAAFAPNLAASLTNQANQRSEIGDRAGALAAIDEAVALRRQLAEANPAAFLPHLAMALNNQAKQRNAVGDRAGALAAIDEAVALRRQLAEANPAAFLPDLAMALNNQATARSDVGDRAGALAAIDEAVTLLRQLTKDNLAAFTPDLAMALNNQANQRSDVGDRAGALAAIDEAVTLLRQLTKDNPAAFTPDLAMALNNQANQRSDVGDRAGALAAIDEAVTYYRQLAEANPAASAPNLAMALNNQANQRSGVGDRAGALAAIDEAVTLLRQLAKDNPAAFTPNLTASLNNQATMRSEIGDRAGALAAIDEAVTLLRQLAKDNPAAFTPDLAMALNNQANQRSDVGDHAGALTAFLDAWRELTPGPRAELIAMRSQWRLGEIDVTSAAGSADIDGALDDLRLAASTAAEPDLPARSGSARRKIRDMVGEVLEMLPNSEDIRSRLPTWTTTDIPESLVILLNQWLNSRDWDARESFVRANFTTLLTNTGQNNIALARFLYPEADTLVDLYGLLEQVRDRGLDETLATYRAAHAHATDLQAWLTAPTWEGARAFLKEHPDLIADPRTLTVLEAASEHPVASQHLSILRLIQQSATKSIDDVYDAVIDPLLATDQAMHHLECLNAGLLDDLLHAVPGLLQLPFTGPYLLAARAALSATELSSDEKPPADAQTAIALAARTGTATQCAAGAARLRRIARREPSVASSFEYLAAQLNSAASDTAGDN
ncbi:tetratricopeptide repeat protein [Amycolatopsis sp. DG1A-15b]|uniref:tetratricopeptide repeat protein n=1 Tax=Amycolatopsis sp. DG1A-15b TaxID=3052846 RepID=UPI00255BF0E8|nr:tetratricopeptide repeat protein [Amycolatopsis sp. DG1A-15b]WIX85720.1 tetratricopeptide repeat protein [Amycolatopsis sp. DG1A-15b]